MTNLEMRELAHSLDLAGIRYACGFSGRKIARALGTHAATIRRYEQGTTPPQGELGNRYLRVILGMRNHLEAVSAPDAGLAVAAAW